MPQSKLAPLVLAGRLRDEREVDRRDRRRLLERAPEQLLRPREPVAQRVAVHVQRGRARGDVEVVGEVGAERLVQRRVGLQHGQDLADLGVEPLGRDLADEERPEVEVLEAHDAPLRVEPAAVRGELGVAQRVVGVGDRRHRPADPDHHARGTRPTARAPRRRRPAPARVSESSRRWARCGTPGLLEPGDQLAADARELDAGGVAAAGDDHEPRGLGEVEPERRRARRQRQRVVRLGGLERLREQRRLDRLLLIAHDVAQPRHRGEQRRRRLRRRLGELADEATARAREHEPARRLVGLRGDRRRDRVPAVDLELDQPGRLVADLGQQRAHRRLARDDLGPPVGADEHDAGLEELREPVDHRLLGLRACAARRRGSAAAP